MTKTEIKQAAQDEVMQGIANVALGARENGNEELADAIVKQGERVAKMYGIKNVPGFPGTFE